MITSKLGRPCDGMSYASVLKHSRVTASGRVAHYTLIGSQIECRCGHLSQVSSFTSRDLAERVWNAYVLRSARP